MTNTSSTSASPPATFGSISARRVALLPALLVLLVTPLFVSVDLGNPIRAQEYLIALSVVFGWLIYLSLHVVVQRKALGPWTGFDGWVAACAGTMTLSVVLSPNRQVSFLSVLVPLAMLSYYFLLADILSSVRATNRIAAGLLVSAAIIAVIGILEYVGIELLPYTQERTNVKQVVLSTLGNPNFVSSFLGPVIFLAPLPFINGVAQGAKRRSLRIAGGGAMLLLLLCIFLSSARGVWLGLFVTGSLLAALYLLGGKRFPLSVGESRLSWKMPAALAVVGMLLIAALVVPSPILKGRFNPMRRLLSTKEVRNRLFYWTVAEEMIWRRPVFGIGYHRFSTSFWNEVVDMQKKPENAFYNDYLVRVRGKMPGEAHNEFIEIAAEQGFVGLAAFLGMLAWFGVSGVTLVASPTMEHTARLRLVCLMAALLVMLVDSLFGFPLQLSASGILFWVMLAMLRTEILEAREL